MDKPSPDLLRSLYVEQRQSTWSIAEQFLVSQMTVRRWLKAAGIESRSHHENPNPNPPGSTHGYGAKISKANKGNPKVGRGNAGKRGRNAPNWRGGAHQDPHGRWYVWDPDAKRYYPRAWFVWREVHPGEVIGRGFVIHHKDWDKTNDSPENLVKLSIADHIKLHRRQEREYIALLQRLLDEAGIEYPAPRELE